MACSLYRDLGDTTVTEVLAELIDAPRVVPTGATLWFFFGDTIYSWEKVTETAITKMEDRSEAFTPLLCISWSIFRTTGGGVIATVTVGDKLGASLLGLHLGGTPTTCTAELVTAPVGTRFYGGSFVFNAHLFLFSIPSGALHRTPTCTRRRRG